MLYQFIKSQSKQRSEQMWEGRLAPMTHFGIAATIATAISVIAPRRGSEVVAALAAYNHGLPLAGAPTIYAAAGFTCGGT
jgi:hypothetical protein